MNRKQGLAVFLTLLVLLALTGIAWQGQGTAEPSPDLSAYPWVYLRDEKPLAPSEEVVELVAVGDVMPGRGVAEQEMTLAGRGEAFTAAPWLRSADLALGNLESAIAPQSGSIPASKEENTPELPYLLIAPPRAAEQLSAAGFDLLGMANNHALDRGLDGLADTGAALEKNGILPLGAAPDPARAYEAVILPAGGLDLAFLAFNAVPSPRGAEWSGEVRGAGTGTGSGWALAGWSRERAIAALQSARERAAAVIVSIHWGYEYETRVDPAQGDIARDLVAAGASLVIGHHPHVVQKIETLSAAGGTTHALVAYSLGNFLFDQGFDETGDGLALRAFFDPQGLRAVQALPVHAGPRPALMAPGEAQSLLERIAPQPVRLAWRCEQQECIPAAAPRSDLTGRLYTDELDLTGDGRPERVALEAGRVRIETGSQPGWESPPEWRVIDLALGDPNRDGRQELLLALQKPDPSGILLSHPFLLGYRRGEFLVLWGGSAVSDPILEVELGDLDGDGLQELAVLEELHDGTGQALSIWRWNGWGFSQVWRSAPGRYANLRLVVGDETGETLVMLDRTGTE